MDINDFHGLKEVIISGIANKVHDERDNYILFSTKDSGENNKFLVTDLNNGLFSLSLVDGFTVKTNKSFNMYDNGDYAYSNIQSFIKDSLKVNGSADSRQSVIDRETNNQLKIIFADLFQRLAGKYIVGYDGDFIRITDRETIEVEIYCWDGKIFVNCPISKVIEHQQGFNQEFDVSQSHDVFDVVMGLLTPNKTRDQFKRAVIHNVKKKLHSKTYYENKETGRVIHAGLEHKGGLIISVVSNGKEDGHFVVKDLSGSNISDFCDAAIKISDRFKPNGYK